MRASSSFFVLTDDGKIQTVGGGGVKVPIIPTDDRPSLCSPVAAKPVPMFLESSAKIHAQIVQLEGRFFFLSIFSC